MTHLQAGSAIPGRTIATRDHARKLASPILHPQRIRAMTNRFELRKQNILAQLGAPDGEYHDLSPKGSVDEPIRELIDEINGLAGLVTTSSCSGRISVFLEGRKSNSADGTDEAGEARAGPGGKGGGGAWLYISHNHVDFEPSTLAAQFGFTEGSSHDEKLPGVDSRYIHLKFEPMVRSKRGMPLNVLTIADSTYLGRIYSQCSTCSDCSSECWFPGERRCEPGHSQEWRHYSNGSRSINRLLV